MIASFIFAALAMWRAPQFEPLLKDQLQRVLPLSDIAALEMRGITFAVALFVAALLATLLGSDSVFAYGLGALVGGLGPRAYQRFKQSKAPDYDS